MTRKKTVLFIRDFRGASGGHIKVHDYFQHLLSTANYEPRIFFTRESVFDERNPWLPFRELFLSRPVASDVYFFAGLDWKIVANEGFEIGDAPVINLIQGLSHADELDEKYEFLSRPAVRICVSHQIADAVLRTKRSNGPVVVNPNGIDLSAFPTVQQPSDARPVFIAGLKQPLLAREIAEGLRQLGVPVDIQTDPISRQSFLSRIARSVISVLLPLPLEGFFLPSLEAMALGSGVVVPDCVGNRSFCLDGHNCLVPAFTAEAMIKSVSVLMSDSDLRCRLVRAGYATAAEYTLERERLTFLEILQRYSI